MFNGRYMLACFDKYENILSIVATFSVGSFFHRPSMKIDNNNNINTCTVLSFQFRIPSRQVYMVRPSFRSQIRHYFFQCVLWFSLHLIPYLHTSSQNLQATLSRLKHKLQHSNWGIPVSIIPNTKIDTSRVYPNLNEHLCLARLIITKNLIESHTFFLL